MIALERKKQPEYKSNGVQIAHAKKSLPFAASTAGIYAHRVRSVDMITMLGESHLAVACWCGMTLLVSTRKKTKLYEEVPDGRPMCATCEAVSYTHLDVYKRQNRPVASEGRAAAA